MARPSSEYRPRDAERQVLHGVVADHLDAFLEAAAQHADGARLPAFVEQEFRHFLMCGVLAHGFARLRCGDCAAERLVPFSCKGRGFCPSCGGRRMNESAARLVDSVLPRVPVRQWVVAAPGPITAVLSTTAFISPMLRTGSVNVNVEPWPSWLFTQIRRPCSSTNLRR